MEKKTFPNSIECDRVLLRKHQLDVAPTMFGYVERDRERLRQFLPWVDSTKTIQDEIEYIKMTHEKWDKFELFDYGIFNRDTDTYMGNVGVHTIAWIHERCELGYWILGDFEGKGFMSDAVSGLEKTCFEMGFNRVEIRCSSLNRRSASVPRKLGYRLEGMLSQDSIEMGRHRDTLIFGKTKSRMATISKVDKSAKSLNPPYFAVIFSSELNPQHPDYENMAERMIELASNQDGFLGVESSRGIDLKGITVSYWSNIEAIKKWREHAEHLEAQRRGKSEWYRNYSIKIAKVER